MAAKKSTPSSKSAPRSPPKKAKAKAKAGAAAAKRPLAASSRKAPAAKKPAAAKKVRSVVAVKATATKPMAAPARLKAAPRPKPAAKATLEREEPKAPRAALAEPAEPGSIQEADPVATAKLAIGPDSQDRKEPRHIPWSYGVDRVTAAAIDPDRLFVYWEVTDPAIERARSALGKGGPGAWLVLRVYDTTGLIFDGTNAHAYFDHVVDRATRQWFFHVGKPTSTAFVEIGMKSTEGYFAKIARSGRVDFPRREQAPWGDPEWMTVQPWSGEVADVHRAPAPPPGPGPGQRSGQRTERGPDALPLWSFRDSAGIHEIVLRHLLDSGWERVEWSEDAGSGWYALEGRSEWESQRVLTSWEAGPFSYPVEIQPPRREEFEGKGFAYRVGDVTHVVQGPWRVVIHDLGARAERALLGSWEIRRSWSLHGERALRVGNGRFTVRAGASEQVAGGASERWRMGASELSFGGASEQLYAGGSQLAYRGASEQAYAGASEARLGGASERAYSGGSERSYSGGSESRLGASDQHFEGAFPYPPAGPLLPGQEK